MVRTRSQTHLEEEGAPPDSDDANIPAALRSPWMLPKYWKRLFNSFRPNLSSQRDFKHFLLDGTAHVHLNVSDLRKVSQELRSILVEEGRLSDASPENFKGVKQRIAAVIQEMLLKAPTQITTPDQQDARPSCTNGGGGRLQTTSTPTAGPPSPVLGLTPPHMLNDIQSTIPSRGGIRTSGGVSLGVKRGRDAAEGAGNEPTSHRIVMPTSNTPDSPQTNRTNFSTVFPSSAQLPTAIAPPAPSPTVVVPLSPATDTTQGASSSLTAAIPYANRCPDSCYPVQGLRGFEHHCPPLFPVVEELKRFQVRPGSTHQMFDVPPLLASHIQSRRCRVVVFPVAEAFDPAEWPPAKHTSVFVNNEPVVTPWKRSWPRKDVRRSYLLLDITSLLPGRTRSHRLHIDCLDADYRRNFVLAVCVKLEVGEVASQISQRRDAAGTERLIDSLYPRFACCPRPKDQPAEDEVQETTLPSLSTKCPISQCQMTLPVRGQFCEHIQPLDLSSYLLSATTSRFSNCPICDAEMRLPDLILDRPLEEALRASRARGGGGGSHLQLYHPTSVIDPCPPGGEFLSRLLPAGREAGLFRWMRAVRSRGSGLDAGEAASSDSEGGDNASSPTSYADTGPRLIPSTVPPSLAPAPSQRTEVIEID